MEHRIKIQKIECKRHSTRINSVLQLICTLRLCHSFKCLLQFYSTNKQVAFINIRVSCKFICQMFKTHIFTTNDYSTIHSRPTQGIKYIWMSQEWNWSPTRTNYNSFIKLFWIIRSCITHHSRQQGGRGSLLWTESPQIIWKYHHQPWVLYLLCFTYIAFSYMVALPLSLLWSVCLNSFKVSVSSVQK